MMDPYISVIIPIYKVEKFIRRCAVSLFNQTLKHGIEYIFVDDCSPDDSVSILKTVLEEYPERKHQVRIIRQSLNQGSAIAREIGLKNSLGRYIIYCDSDDWVDVDMYRELLEKAMKDNCDIVVCDYIEEYVHNNKNVYLGNWNDGNSLKKSILEGKTHNALWNKLIKKSLFIENNIHFEDGVNFWEDVSVICRIIDNVKQFGYVNRPLYHYTQYNSNSYIANRDSRYIRQMICAGEIVSNYYLKKNDKYCSQIIKTRTLSSCIGRVSIKDIKKLLKEYKDIKYKQISFLNLSLPNKFAYFLMMNRMPILGKIIFEGVNIIRKLSMLRHKNTFS